jgi:hypothetical protein
MRYERRIRTLEARRAARDRLASDLVDALQHTLTTAVRAKLARRLNGEAETAEQAAQHAALLKHWRALFGDSPAVGVRARIATRLEQMAERQRAYTLSLTTP